MDQSSNLLDRIQLERQYRRTATFGVLVAFFVLMVMISISLLAYRQTQDTFANINQIRFDNDVVTIVNSFRENFDIYPQAMKAVRGFIQGSMEVNGEEWQTFIDSLELEEQFPGLTSINYGEVVQATQSAAFEQRVREDPGLVAEIYREFEIHPRTENPNLYPIRYISPLAGRENLVGFDRGSDVVRSKAIQMAIDTGQVQASDVTEIIPGEARGYVLYLAVYEPGEPLETVDQRRMALRGLVSSQFALEETFASFIPETAPLENIDVEIFNQPQDETVNQARLLYDSKPSSLHDNLPSQGKYRHSHYEINVAGVPWTMHFNSPTSSDISQAGGLTPELVLISGLVFSFLLAGLVGILVVLRVNAYRIAIELTEDLEDSRRAMNLLISNLPGAAYRHENEPTLRLTYASSGIYGITGWEADDFITGRVKLADLITPEFKSKVWQDIQGALQNRLPFRLNFSLMCRDNLLRWVWAQGQGVFDDQDQLRYIEGFMMDVTAQHQSEEKLAARAAEMEKLNQILIGREEKMAELKRVINTNNHS